MATASRMMKATVTAAEPVDLRALLFCALTLLAILGSGFAVIHASHKCREMYAALQVLEASQWQLQEDYGRLLLEESTWASHRRVEKVATGQLHMQAPAVHDLRVVAP